MRKQVNVTKIELVCVYCPEEIERTGDFCAVNRWASSRVSELPSNAAAVALPNRIR